MFLLTSLDWESQNCSKFIALELPAKTGDAELSVDKDLSLRATIY